MSRKVCRALDVKAAVYIFQRIKGRKGRGIDKLVICPVYGKPRRLQAVKRLKAVVPRFLAAFELVDGEGVSSFPRRVLLGLRCLPLLLKLGKMPVDLGDKLVCRSADGFKGRFQLLNILAAAPPGDIAEGVVRGVQPEMLADGKGDALGLHLAGASVCAVLFLSRRVQINVVQLGMGDLMDQGLNRLQLAHALVNGNALVLQMVVPVCAAFDFLKGDGDGRSLLQSLEKILVLLYAARQRVYRNVRDLPALGLA